MTPSPALGVQTVFDRTEYRQEPVIIDEPGETAWAHHGVAIAPDGAIHTADASARHLVILRGETVERVPFPGTELHGLAVDHHGETWAADPGHKAERTAEGTYEGERLRGRVLRLRADGVVTAELFGSETWRPCDVALSDFGTLDDRVWVADGYGDSIVYAFDVDGTLLWKTDGEETGKRFRQPHAIIVDSRSTTPTLLVADRANQRIVRLTLEGEFLGEFGRSALTSPSGFALDGDRLLVTELDGRIVAFGPDDEAIGSIGTPLRRTPEAWPNVLRDGAIERPRSVGVFRAPHGIAVTGEGDIIVTEWLIGGRVTRLVPQLPA
ncbi:hypothetical protein ESP57_08545 [Agromyces fucosus]|uniref:Peptidylglycine monooxygenase n=1 Tax=Agromyces fucosus TaxID=41985 RepID=A0A4Q2JLG2_9MICO|nr:NHL repeat-containing protein [Agromyces fucosus]RXZ49001.1 hypothetical protein ESP57_08545 [Agromyces fucosus]